MKKTIMILLSAVLLLAGCGQIMDGDGMVRSYTQISQEEAKEMMTRDDGHIVVDVRRQDEYGAGHIPGAILIPNEDIGTTPPESLPDLNQIILIYCRNGNRSKQAAQKLFDMGYTNIYEFGGINTWTGEIVTGDSVAQNGPTAAVLSFSSFDGGGYEYSVEIGDPSILAYSDVRDYGSGDHSQETGSSFTETFTFTGLKPGRTTVAVYGRSPILENEDALYTATVDEDLNVTLQAVRAISVFYLYRSVKAGWWSYQITRWPEGYLISVDEGEDQSINGEIVDALLQIIEDVHLEQWDGFNEDGQDLEHKEAFWLDIQMTDGTGISARGDDAFPENYFEAMDRIQAVLDSAGFSPEAEMDEILDKEDNDAAADAIQPVPTLVIEANSHTFYADLEDNTSAEALVENLGQKSVELELHDYGDFEKVGPLPWSLPRNDASITTVPGDVILYQGDQLTIYYDENTWDFTRLAKIEGVTREELLSVFGEGNVTVKLWIEWSE